MDEHVALLEQADRVRSALGTGDRHGAVADLRVLVERLHRHVHREEAGIFTALREQGEFADEVAALEGEHEDLDAAIAGLDPDASDFARRVAGLFAELSAHVEREDLGVFPVSVVTLGASGWDVVERAHEASPSFLTDAPAVTT
jgi:hemerythrin-like domain-containing protein